MIMTLGQLKTRSTAAVRRFLRRRGLDLIRTEVPRFQVAAPSTVGGSSAPASNDRLAQLRRRYRDFDCPASVHTHWELDRVESLVDLDDFRGHGMFLWQYIERPVLTDYKFFIYLSHLERIDRSGLLDRVEEDGAFGAPRFEFPGRKAVSRDLLDSVNEILFLDRELEILRRSELRVLDIGAGYGRLAYRMSQLVPGLTDYACVDAVPESTFSCERYLSSRGVMPPARVIELPDAAAAITSSSFDLAVNVHSFSEMSAAAATYWISLAAEAEIPFLFVVPNQPTSVLSHEADGSKQDLVPVFGDFGYELGVREPIIDDPAARALFGIDDHFHLFRRT